MVDSELVDSELLKVESFESFYTSVWDQVYRAVAVGIGDADVASESVDEAMVRAYERWTKVSMMDNPEGWVYRTAMNWARSRLRRRKFRSNSQLPDMPLDDSDGADPRLIEAIRHLPFHQREVVVARYLLDMSEQQTAGAFGVPAGTIKSRLHRALATLKKELT
jgi:RNA polymerase sigma-70 factor (ECF subfamily)